MSLLFFNTSCVATFALTPSPSLALMAMQNGDYELTTRTVSLITSKCLDSFADFPICRSLSELAQSLHKVILYSAQVWQPSQRRLIRRDRASAESNHWQAAPCSEKPSSFAGEDPLVPAGVSDTLHSSLVYSLLPHQAQLL